MAKDDDQGLENQNNNQMEVGVGECKEFGRTRTHSRTTFLREGKFVVDLVSS